LSSRSLPKFKRVRKALLGIDRIRQGDASDFNRLKKPDATLGKMGAFSNVFDRCMTAEIRSRKDGVMCYRLRTSQRSTSRAYKGRFLSWPGRVLPKKSLRNHDRPLRGCSGTLRMRRRFSESRRSHGLVTSLGLKPCGEMCAVGARC